jgi:hypothetical protein
MQVEPISNQPPQLEHHKGMSDKINKVWKYVKDRFHGKNAIHIQAPGPVAHLHAHGANIINHTGQANNLVEQASGTTILKEHDNVM